MIEQTHEVPQLNVPKKLMKKSKYRLISFFFIMVINVYILFANQSKALFFFRFSQSEESISSYGSYQLILWILLVFVILFLIGYVRLLLAYFKSRKMDVEAYEKAYNFFDLFSIVPIFFLVIMTLNSLFFTTAVVSQDSMNNTYQENDFVLINYRQAIDKEDVIIFEKDKLYIKRVMGLPGDYLKVTDLGVWINDDFITDIPLHHGYEVFEYDGVIEEGYYFVLGDNRSVSIDSRYGVLGFVLEDEIIGGVMFEHEKSVIE